MIDFLIVGAGIFGCTCARELTDAGYSCLLIDKRSHIGGNCYTENIDGINVHKYGGHIVQTDNKDIWDYLTKYTEFNGYINRVKVNYLNKIYSFPVNLFTLNQLWGVISPAEAGKILEEKRIKIDNPQNLEEWILSQVGEEIYRTFIYGYTKKHWGTEPKNLPANIIQRLPSMLNFDDRYFKHKYQGIPMNGYKNLFDNLVKGSDIKLNTTWNSIKNKNIAKNIIFSGRIDEFYSFKFGKLEFRSLKFEEERLDIEDFQGNAVINYTDENIPYTRILEHKHFDFSKQQHTIITREYPSNIGEPFYPIGDKKNLLIYEQYLKESKKWKNIYFGGRLGDYLYANIDEIVEDSLTLTKKFKKYK